MKAFLGFLILFFLTESCRKSKEVIDITPSAVDSIWYPVPIGMWWEYKMDSTHYKKSSNDTSVTIVSTSSFIKEEVIEKIEEFTDGTSYKLALYYKKDISSNWVFKRYNTLRVYSNKIIKTEDDLSFVKLFYPVTSNFSWKGTAYIDVDETNKFLENWNNTYVNLNSSKTFNSLNFDTTVTVNQIDDSNAIAKIYAQEIFAKRVGLLYSEIQNLEKQNTINTWAYPENGFKVTKTIIDYKK